jgi:transcriptional regulator with XRE-family HTH domain
MSGFLTALKTRFTLISAPVRIGIMTRRIVETPLVDRIDGKALKRIREEKRLTQLYVSKVVGVTTDTVSRWENNRYPSIRRENILKLAEALEADVDEFLYKPVVTPEAVGPPPGSRWPLVLSIVLAGIALLALLTVVLRQEGRRPPPPASITAERILPGFAAPGVAIPVRVRLTQRAEEGGFILREYLPKGWKLLQSNPPASSLDNDKGMVRWIIKAGDPRERIVYLVQVDRSAQADTFGNFQGEIVAGSADGQAAVPVEGEGRVAIAPILWADSNGDRRVDDGEMLQASYTVDEMAGVHIDWLELERIWNAGSYFWDEARGKFLPVKPLDTPPGK